MANKGLNLQLDEEAREKLEALARKSGKTKTAVIRQLILGRPLGDRTDKQTLAKLTQLGGMLGHLASVLAGKEGAEVVAMGIEIREMALKLSVKEEEHEEDANDHL